MKRWRRRKVGKKKKSRADEMDFCWSKIEAMFSKDFDIGLRDGQVSQIGAVL